MAVMRWRTQGLEPWSSAPDIGEMQSEMNRLFDTFFGRPAQLGVSERVWAPVADMYETKDELVIKLALAVTVPVLVMAVYLLIVRRLGEGAVAVDCRGTLADTSHKELHP